MICIKYNKDINSIFECSMKEEDGHCFHCPFLDYPTYSNKPLSEDTIKEVLKKIIEVNTFAVKNKRE